MKHTNTSLLNSEQIQGILKIKGLEHKQSEVLKALETYVTQYLNDRVKEEKNKSRIAKSDLKKDQVPVEGNLSKEAIESLPTWVRCKLKNASLIGNSKKVIQTKDGKKYHLDNRLNSLAGSEWTFFLNSVINTRYPTTGKESYAHHIRKTHPSPKPPQLTRQIIEFFTKEGDIVFDYFMGVGGTLLGASLCGRRALGVELSSEYVSAYKEASKSLGLAVQSTIIGDAIGLLREGKTLSKAFNGEQASLILIDPPYGNMMARYKTGEATKKKADISPTPYTNSEFDLGNMSLNNFYGVFKESVQHSLKFLKDKGHLVIFIKDLQPKDKELNLLHAELIYSLNKIPEINYLGLKIWADQGVNLYPYGYPYSYVSNQIHQYILVFRNNKV